MYIPNINRLNDEHEIFRFMRENPFAIVVSELDGKIVATHLPAELEINEKDEKVIRSHMAKANRQWKEFSADKELMVIFNGPHTYISSSWYDHVNVPTWDYIAIHVYGRPKILDDDATYAMLERLVNRYEQSSEHPFKMEQLSDDYIKDHLRAVVAFEISIDRIDAKEKLSQNRDEKNYDRILKELDKRQDEQSKAVKREMERVQKKLSKNRSGDSGT